MALLNPPNIFRIRELFTAALKECALSLPSNDEAREHVLRFWLSEIVARRIEPFVGLGHIVHEVDVQHSSPSAAPTYAGAELNISRLIGLYWEYRDLAEEGRLKPEWQAEIRAANRGGGEKPVTNHSGLTRRCTGHGAVRWPGAEAACHFGACMCQNVGAGWRRAGERHIR